MLRDRKALLEHDAEKLKQACGHLYLKMVMSETTAAEKLAYETMRAELTDIIADIAIVEQMISDGHK